MTTPARIAAWNAAAFAVALATPATAQSVALERVSTTLGQCIGTLENRVDELTAAKKRIAELEAELKTLKSHIPEFPETPAPDKK